MKRSMFIGIFLLVQGALWVSASTVSCQPNGQQTGDGLSLDEAIAANVSQGIIDNWWRQGMMVGFQASYDCIKAFSETDFTADLTQFNVPTLIIHGEDDHILPIDDSARLSAKLIPNATLKTYPGFSHGMCTVDHEIINADLLVFFREEAETAGV